jgi:hypothetical protein
MDIIYEKKPVQRALKPRLVEVSSMARPIRTIMRSLLSLQQLLAKNLGLGPMARMPSMA